MDTDIYYAGTLIVAFLVALRLVQLSSNKELTQDRHHNIMHFRHSHNLLLLSQKKKKKKSLLFGAMKSMNNSMNRELEGFANGLGQAMMGPGKADNTSWRERQAEADQEARRRANALDNGEKSGMGCNGCSEKRQGSRQHGRERMTLTTGVIRHVDSHNRGKSIGKIIGIKKVRNRKIIKYIDSFVT